MRPEPDVVLGGRYRLVRLIAVGGMGEVWEAIDTLLDRRVAVKILKEEFRTASTFLDRFRAEARHAGQLTHRGIATVYDYGETEDLAFLVMELVRGRTLSELLTDHPDLSTAAKLSILCQAASGLQAAHEAGVVHRDVKPGNLMVRDDGTVKVTDFGIARALSSAPLTDHGQMIGTPAYVSPEQATGARVTGASDIYSLAVVAYEMFAGHAPFERDTSVALALAHVNDPPPPLPDSVPAGIAGLIESALSKDPSLRPPSAGHFAEQLRREMTPTRSVPSRSPVPHRAPAATFVPSSPTSAASVPSPTLAGPVSVEDATHRRTAVFAVAFAGLVVVVGATIWAATRPTAADESRSEPAAVSATSVPGVVTPTSPPPQPAAAQPVPITQPATITQPAATQPAATQPAATQPAVTQPAATQPATTQPATTQPVDAGPPEIAATPRSTQPPPTAPAADAVSDQSARIEESEALAFVADYYERVDAGDYEATWTSLSPGFRDARNLTFERYVSYWENTTLELRALRFVDGPGADESRVIFEARYDTGSRTVDETDEITLRRFPDGHLAITAQRIV